MLSRLKFLLIALVLGTAGAAWAQPAVPPAGSRVTDLTQTLSVSQTETLAHELERIDLETGARVLVLIVGSLDGAPIEDYAQRVFDSWKPGRAGVDDGVLLVLAKNERRMRIAVGRGLEGAIPDLAAKRITQSRMVPAFKQERFADGFLDAVHDIDKLIRAEKLPAPVASSSAVSPYLSAVVVVLSILVLGVMVVVNVREARERRERLNRAMALDAELEALRRRETMRNIRSRTYSAPSSAMSETRVPVGSVPRRAAAASAVRSSSSSSRSIGSRRSDSDSPASGTLFGSGSGGSGSNDYSTSSSAGTSAGGGATDSY